MPGEIPSLWRTTFALLLVGVVLGCGRTERSADRAAPPPTRSEIFAAITARTERYRLEPAFVYALVAAESNFDPRARNGDACGLLQLKPIAWRT
ncbi:MAG: transglycosylase SLT domain-containing protein, partial [Opitutus sp.]